MDSGKYMRRPDTSVGQNVCGILVSPMEPSDAKDLVLSRARMRAPLAVSALAVHGVMTGVLSDQQKAHINQLDVVAPDGQPVRWALNLLYSEHLRERVSGPKLMLSLCGAAANEGLGIYLYGSTPKVLRLLEDNLTRRFPTLQIVGTRPSNFGVLDIEEQKEVAASIRKSGASICFVGLGCPRQETFCWAMRDLVGIPLLAVGAAFDFNAGLAKPAPQWMEQAGLHWLHRLASEPRRLWRRYLLLNPAYLTLLTAQFVGLWKPSIKVKPDYNDSTLIPG